MLGNWPLEPGLWVLLVCAGGVYALGVGRLRTRGKRWSRWRSGSYGAGLAAVAVALVSPLATEDQRFPAHMAQHMLLGMLGPVLLALSAPVTLALRTLPRAGRVAVLRVLHLRWAGDLAHPVTATAVLVAGLVMVYFTPLYEATLRHPLLHELVHVHFLAGGCLFAWTFIGTDPVPRRGSMKLRIALLFVALGAHAALAKLLYAGYGDVTSAGAADVRRGAELMYYGGDLVDLIVLVAFFSQWYAAQGRRLRHHQRRARSLAGVGDRPGVEPDDPRPSDVLTKSSTGP